MKAVGYCRVSTTAQADNGQSLEVQEEKIRAMAVVQGVELVEIIIDAGESAKSLSRPGMTRLITLVDAGEVQAVIVAKLDRLTRSVRDLADILERFQRRGVSLVSVAETLDTGTAAGRLVLNIMASVSQWEREAIGERTRDVLRFKHDNGFKTGGEVPFGFDLIEGGRLVKNQEEQRIIKLIKGLRKQAVSYRAICAELEGKGIKTKKGGLKWNPKTVRKIAENY